MRILAICFSPQFGHKAGPWLKSSAPAYALRILFLYLNFFALKAAGQVYLLTAVPLFSVPQLSSSPALNHLVVLSLPHLLPVAHIGMVSLPHQPVAFACWDFLNLPLNDLAKSDSF